MADWQNPDEDGPEDEEYFSEVLEGAEETGLEPKFVKIGSMVEPVLSMVHEMNIAELVATYRFARDQLATDRKAYKQRETRVKTHLAVLSMLMRDMGDKNGVDSFSTANGTAYRNKKTSYRVGVWDEVAAYVLQSGNIHMLQKRVSPNAVKEIIEQDGAIPPGVEELKTEEFAVRSPTTRARR